MIALTMSAFCAIFKIMKHPHAKFQYRYYEIPPDSYTLALLGASWIREYDNDKDLHFHNCLEIGYCYNGGGIMTFGDKKLPYAKRMFTIIPAQYPHNTNSKMGKKCQWEFLFVSVDSFLTKLIPNNTYARTQLIQRINKEALLLKHDENPLIANLVLSIMDEHRHRANLFLESINGLLQSLLINIARFSGNDLIDADAGRGVGAIAASIDYIDKNYVEKITVSLLADICHMSETHFRRTFLESMNISPHAYINRIRIEEACRLLHTTNEPIGDIAIKCGFITITVLNRNFKKIVGMTPTEWRKDSYHYERNRINDTLLPYEGWR